MRGWVVRGGWVAVVRDFSDRIACCWYYYTDQMPEITPEIPPLKIKPLNAKSEYKATQTKLPDSLRCSIFSEGIRNAFSHRNFLVSFSKVGCIVMFSLVCVCICAFVCLYVCQRDISKSFRILMIFLRVCDWQQLIGL